MVTRLRRSEDAWPIICTSAERIDEARLPAWCRGRIGLSWAIGSGFDVWTSAGCTPFAIGAGPSSRNNGAGGDEAVDESGEKLHSGDDVWEKRAKRKTMRGGVEYRIW